MLFTGMFGNRKNGFMIDAILAGLPRIRSKLQDAKILARRGAVGAITLTKFRKFSKKFAFFLAVLSPVAAWAADLPSKSTPPQPAPPVSLSDWSGFYAGSFVGAADGVISTAQATKASAQSFGYATGGLAGYNFQSGPYVYGLEGDISSDQFDKDFAARPGLPASHVDSIYSLQARARLGYDFGAFLPFIAGGLVVNRSEQYLDAPFEFDGHTKTREGWTLGAGVDVKAALPVLGPSVLRAEYLYEGLPTTTFNLNGPNYRTAQAAHYFRLAIITRIGEPRPAATTTSTVDWSGDYAGFLAGGVNDGVKTNAPGLSTSFSASGPGGGIYAGSNWAFGSAVLGFEGATMLENVTGHGPQPGAIDTSYRGYFEGDVRGRAGYAFGRFLPFIAAGVMLQTSQQVDRLTGNQRGRLSDMDGTIGAGIDYMVTDRISLRGEYLYGQSFSTADTHLDSDTCCKQSRSTNMIRVGAAYWFH
jgi:outer membrane immunogenic protein